MSCSVERMPAGCAGGVGDQLVAHEHRDAAAAFLAEGALRRLPPAQFPASSSATASRGVVFDDEIPDRPADHLLGAVAEQRELGLLTRVMRPSASSSW